MKTPHAVRPLALPRASEQTPASNDYVAQQQRSARIADNRPHRVVRARRRPPIAGSTTVGSARSSKLPTRLANPRRCDACRRATPRGCKSQGGPNQDGPIRAVRRCPTATWMGISRTWIRAACPRAAATAKAGSGRRVAADAAKVGGPGGCSDGCCGPMCGDSCEPGCRCSSQADDLCMIGVGDDESCHTVRVRIPKCQEVMVFGGVHGFKGPFDRFRDSGNFGFQEGINVGAKFRSPIGVINSDTRPSRASLTATPTRTSLTHSRRTFSPPVCSIERETGCKAASPGTC